MSTRIPDFLDQQTLSNVRSEFSNRNAAHESDHGDGGTFFNERRAFDVAVHELLRRLYQFDLETGRTGRVEHHV